MKTMKKMMTLLAVAGLVLALAPAAQGAAIYTAPSGSLTESGAMPGLVDGSDAFFTFKVNFTAFTYSDNGVGNPDIQVLFSSGGDGKGISLVLIPDGTLAFRSGGAGSSVSETTVDLPTSGLSTGVELQFVASFNATANTLDLYLNESTKTTTTTLLATTLAGTDGYSVALPSGGNAGAWSPNGSKEDLDFANGTISDFVVYDDLTEALATTAITGTVFFIE